MRSRRLLSTFGVLLLLMLCRTAFALDPHRAISQYLRDRWSTNDTFPGGQVSSIVQTPDNCLWIGGEKGLVRFDGLSFQLLQESSKGVPLTHVQGLATDAEGGLWIWMQGANILRYFNGKFENVTATLGLPDESVTALSQSSDGGVLLSTIGQETFEYRRGHLHKAGFIRVPGTLIVSTAKTDDGRIWIGTSDTGLFYVQGNHLARMFAGFSPKKINVLLAASGNTVWIGTDQGLFFWDGQHITTANVPSSLRSGEVFTLAYDRDGNLWAGTPHGLFRCETHIPQAAEPSATQPDLEATALFQDREGDLWIGDAQGLQRWRDGAFVAYSASAEVPGGGPVFADADGRLWFGPAEGGLASIASGKVNRTDAAHLDKDIVYSIAGSGNDLWVGRQRGGLTHIIYNADTLSTRTYTEANGLAQNSVYVVQVGHDGTVWAGTLNAGLSRFKDGTFTTYRTADGLASNTITALEQDARNDLWVATPNGLSVLRAGGWRTYGLQNGLPSDEVTALLRSRSGGSDRMWIGTAAGLALFSSDRIQTFASAPEILRQPVLGLAEDRSGFLWVATPEQILRLDPDKLRAGTLETADVREYDRNDGLLSSEGVRRSRSMLEDGAGRIWVSTRAGLVATNPADFTRPSVPAVVQIKALLADGREIPLQEPRIPAWQRRITFQLSGVSLPVPGRVRYRYRLDGFDKAWSEATSTREAVYTHLDPGSYRFHVIASNSDGVWNTSDTSLPFVIEPALWQALWFRLCAVLVALLTIWWLYVLRTRQLAKQLHLRFEERLAERMRIAQDLHDTLLQGFLSASLQLDVATEYVPPESPAAPMLTRVLVLMRQVSEDTRNSLGMLRTGDRFSENLEGGLSDLPRNLGLEKGASYRVLVNGSSRLLEPLCSDEIFLIGREAVLNAFRHASATLIEVELAYKRSGLQLFIRDNGIGIAEQIVHSGKERHWGLTGMRERATKIGAQFRIWSRPGEGTEVELIVHSNVAYVRNKREGLWKQLRAVLPFKRQSLGATQKAP